MIRYPGSKDKIVAAIEHYCPDAFRIGGLFSRSQVEYREPFFGAGAVGFRLLDRLRADNAIWINDLDHGMRCLWLAVCDSPHELTALVRHFQPSVAAFYRFREEDGRKDLDPLIVGFRKLVLHQTSFSGLGAMAGGPIGGRQQSSAYNVQCRWNASRLCRDIADKSRILRRFSSRKITEHDFEHLITDASPDVFLYLDPPYVKQGPQLYKHAMTEADHVRLASAIKGCRAQWVLSYDDDPMIRNLYAWATIERVQLTYTTAVAKEFRRKNSEVIITR